MRLNAGEITLQYPKFSAGMNWVLLKLLLRWSLLGVFLWSFSAQENMLRGWIAFLVACVLEIRPEGVQPRSWKYAKVIGYGFPALAFVLYLMWVSFGKSPFWEMSLRCALLGFAAGQLIYRDWKYSSKVPDAVAS